MRVVIIEDETAATINLLAIIAEVCPGVEVLATLESVTDAVSWFENNPVPDVVFMDIHLADGDAFRIFEKTEVGAPVIFTTAYDQYALDAFRVNSIDYLLKPIKASDLQRAMDKLKRLTGGAVQSYIDRVHVMAAGHNRQETLLVHVRDKIIPLKSEDIAFCHTADERTYITTMDGRMFPYDKSLEGIIAMLPEDSFFRANRQFIIARRAITDISVWFGSRLSVNMSQPTPEKIIISKARVPVFKKWLSGVTNN